MIASSEAETTATVAPASQLTIKNRHRDTGEIPVTPDTKMDYAEIVLVEGTLDDVRGLVNGPELVRLWDEMFLPPWVRAAWRALIDSARSAAYLEQGRGLDRFRLG